jgi:hypothetical protein
MPPPLASLSWRLSERAWTQPPALCCWSRNAASYASFVISGADSFSSTTCDCAVLKPDGSVLIEKSLEPPTANETDASNKKK